MNYNQKGLSTWSNTHAIVHSNNKAQLITQDKDGDYRITKEVNSIMKTFTLIEKKEFKAHFTNGAKDEEAVDDGYKYKAIVDNEELYCISYRDLALNSFLTERQARSLIEKKEYLGCFLEVL